MNRLVQQLLKFGVVGALAFLIDYSLLMLLSQLLGLHPVFSAAVSFVIALIFNYLASMHFVFSHREELSKEREFFIFVVLSCIGLGINELCMWIGTGALGTSAVAVTVVKLLATAIVMVWNFVSRKTWLDGGVN